MLSPEMLSQKLNEFRINYAISSIDKWAEISTVSKSTILRALNGKEKNMGMKTLYMLVQPYGGSIDELFNLGAFSSASIEKEESKAEICEKLETVIEVIETVEELPQETTEELKTALVEVHEHITNEPAETSKCVLCAAYRETIAELKKEKESKNKWLFRLFRMNFIMLGILFAMFAVIATLTISLVSALH